MKLQQVRLLDVFIFGPLMLYAARNHLNKAMAAALIAMGVGTIYYNGRNFLLLEQDKKKGAEAP